MNTIIYIVLQATVILLVAPLVNGIINKVKAFSQKRKGASVFQMYYDLLKLFRKSCVVSETASWIFKVAPWILFATSLTAGMLVPVTTLIHPLHYPGDVILLLSLLALGRFFMMLAGLDTGSTFGGMGSSREGMISSLMEPSILVCLFTVSLVAGSTSMASIVGGMQELGTPLAKPVFILIFLAMLTVIMAETARIPVDDPSTHLELTMVHEAMILEYSGRQLALMEYGSAIKQLLLMDMVVNFFFPHDQFLMAGVSGVLLSLLIYLAKVILLSLLIAFVEVSTVKFKLFSIPNLAALAFILSFLGFFQYFVIGGSHV